MTTRETTPFDGAALERSPVAWQSSPIYVVWDVDGTVREASASYAALVRMSDQEVIGRPWPDLVAGEEDLGWQQLRFSVETLRSASVVVVDMPTNATGETTWLRWTEWGVHDERGELVQVHSTALDVTELHEARGVLASVFETVVAARTEGRREVVEQLHNGAVQHLVAALWALDGDDPGAARSLVNDALAAVRSSMDTLDPPSAGAPVPDLQLPLWHRVATAGRDAELPESIRSAVVDSVSDAVAVLSSSGAVWLSPRGREALFDDATDVDLVRTNGPKLALALSLDVTDHLGSVDDPMDVQLAERERIARDLHDDALQQLAGLRWMLIGRDVDREVIEEVDAVEAAIRSQLADLYSAVARFGLVGALAHLVDHVATPIVASWPPDIDDLPVAVAEVLFRSAREALRNVDQHARASKVVLTIEVSERSVLLTVSDDGVGVQQRQLVAADRAGHLGVPSMREAALAAGGRFELAAVTTGGTRLRVELPR